MLLTCHEVNHRLMDYQAGILSPRELLGVNRHLRFCDACRKEYAVIEEVRRWVRQGSLQPPPHGYLESLPMRLAETNLRTEWFSPRMWARASFAVVVLAVAIGVFRSSEKSGVETLAAAIPVVRSGNGIAATPVSQVERESMIPKKPEKAPGVIWVSVLTPSKPVGPSRMETVAAVSHAVAAEADAPTVADDASLTGRTWRAWENLTAGKSEWRNSVAQAVAYGVGDTRTIRLDLSRAKPHNGVHRALSTLVLETRTPLSEPSLSQTGRTTSSD